MKKEKQAIDKEIEEYNPYQIDKLSKIPSWIVIGILKYWAAAAAVFFILIGGIDIGIDFSVIEDQAKATAESSLALSFKIIILITLGLTLMFTYIVRPIVRLLYNRRNNTYRYNMVNIKGILSLVLNWCYMFFISFTLFLVIVYFGYRGWIPNLFGKGNYGIEPFSYGLFFMIIDTIMVIIKDLLWNLIQRIKYNRQIKGA